jgi:hypothetical protein
MIKTTYQSQPLSNNTMQVFKPDNSKLITLASEMISQGRIKTSLEFAQKFMFTFDSKEQFPINIMTLVEMGVFITKQKAKKMLIKHFIKETDYTLNFLLNSRVYRVKSSHGGQNKEIIMLTIDCFKSMCMISLNDTGKKIQRYYLDLEKVFKQYIINEFNLKNQQLQKAEEEKFQIMHKYNSRLQKHRYYKFKKTGPCFYIISQGLKYKDGVSRIKIGICGCSRSSIRKCPNCECDLTNKTKSESFDARLQNHRTLWPQLQVKFAVYTNDASLLEKCMKRIYKRQINPGGHEIIESIPVIDIINEVKKYLDMFNVFNKESEYLIEENIDIYNKVTETQMKRLIKQEITEEVKEVILDVEEEIEEKKEQIEKVQEEIKKNETEIDMYKKYLKNLETYTVKQLASILKKLGLIQKGLKKVKQDRLKKFLQKEMSDHSDNILEHSDKEVINNINKYSYEDLKILATRYNLRQIGTCTDLCNRILGFLQQGKIDSKRRKDVFQYDKQGNLVKHWRTITELSETLKMCKNYMAKWRNSRCLINGYIWMSRPTVFTIQDIREINEAPPRKTRRNLTRTDHEIIRKKYRNLIKTKAAVKAKHDLMGEYGISKTQIIRLVKGIK